MNKNVYLIVASRTGTEQRNQFAGSSVFLMLKPNISFENYLDFSTQGVLECELVS